MKTFFSVKAVDLDNDRLSSLMAFCLWLQGEFNQLLSDSLGDACDIMRWTIKYSSKGFIEAFAEFTHDGERQGGLWTQYPGTARCLLRYTDPEIEVYTHLLFCGEGIGWKDNGISDLVSRDPTEIVKVLSDAITQGILEDRRYNELHKDDIVEFEGV
ncbi:MAG: hypothetical protein WC244_00235 [Patescibacteria group bacterium]|jgi:hypothetical protein